MKNVIKILDTVDELAEYFASLLVFRIAGTSGNQPFSWLLSGGNTPKLFFRKIATNFRDSIDWNRVQIFWGDERCVGPEDEDSNYKMAWENLLDHIPIPASNIFRIRGETIPGAEAIRYGELFARNIRPFSGIPQADLVMLGMGEDGHTASIFPANIDLFKSNALFETSEHPVTKQKRITATGRVINRAKMVVMLAPGEAKAPRVAQILNRLDGWDRLPAAHVKPENGEMIWLLDREGLATK